MCILSRFPLDSLWANLYTKHSTLQIGLAKVLGGRALKSQPASCRTHTHTQEKLMPLLSRSLVWDLFRRQESALSAFVVVFAFVDKFVLLSVPTLGFVWEFLIIVPVVSSCAIIRPHSVHGCRWVVLFDFHLSQRPLCILHPFNPSCWTQPFLKHVYSASTDT